MSADMQTLEGWYTLHDFRQIDWVKWQATPFYTRQEIVQELLDLTSQFEAIHTQKEGSFGIYSMLGHKADLMLMQLRPTLEATRQAELAFSKSLFAGFTTPSYSYVSMVELSNYVVQRDTNPLDDPHVQARLFPSVPQKQHICFYPMNKKREGQDNWYTLSLEERRRLMHAHGMTGRAYAGKITQMIGGSIGLDDWEWGVTLFADDPLQFKKVVTDMRFDEVSARYGEFGSFYVGTKLNAESLAQLLA